MANQVPSLTLDGLDKLLLILPEKDRFMLIMAGMGASDENRTGSLQFSQWQKKIKCKLAAVQTACKKHGINTKNLTKKPLEAPVDVLDISDEIRSLLKSEGALDYVRDVYGAGLTTTACINAGARKADVSALNLSLVRLRLPRLPVSKGKTAIGRFCSPEYLGRLFSNERILLNEYEWGDVDPRDVAKSAGIPGVGLMPQIVKRLKKKLLRD